MYIYIYVYIHVYIYIYRYMCVYIYIYIYIFSGIFQRIVTFLVNAHWTFPKDFQWHSPMKLHFVISGA